MKISTLWTVLALVGASAFPAGCSQGPEPPRRDGETGGIQLGLDLAPGSSLSQATYTITGPDGYLRSVTVTLGTSPKLSTFIGGTPPGRGYRLSVTGLASDGVSVCSGVSAPFDVVGGRTTVVSLVLRCQEPEATGSIQTNGSLNYCAAVDSLMARPSEAPIGGTIALTSSSHDKDGGPAAIAFAWTATSGTFDDSTGASANFLCTSAGSATITLTITDGDCGDRRSVTVTCTGATTPGQPAVDAGVQSGPADARAAPEAATPADPCLICESTSAEPACATRYNRCVSMAGFAATGPAAGAPKKDLCVDLYTCVHSTRCDVGGSLRDCFCGKLVDEYTCKMNATGVCRAAFYAAGESLNNATILARFHDPAFALAMGVELIEECEQKPAPLCGPSCGH